MRMQEPWGISPACRSALRLALCTLFVGAAARAQEEVLLREGFEDEAGPRLQLHGANQPYEQHALAITTAKAHSGTHSLKVDYDYLHGLQVYLAPRSNETPQVEWGALGSAGTFHLPGLGLVLRPDRGYLLSVYVWVEQASPQNPLQIEVETLTESDAGPVRTATYLEPAIAAPTAGWVRIEQELTSTIIAQLEAGGSKTADLRLNSISLNSFANGRYRLTAYADDLEVREIPLNAVADRRRQAAAAGPKPQFRAMPAVEDLFVWGVYGGIMEPGPDWLKPFDRTAGADVRAQQAERVREFSDWALLDLRRHYCNLLIQGGGMLFPLEGQSAYDYVKACLDECARYGVRFSPSTYLTQHYSSQASREQCEAAMRKAVDLFGKHPALLAYWLVDEPGAATADDFYWGKQTLEAIDPEHPALCTCNSISSIRTFADRLPILCIDYYPMAPVPWYDKGAWAVGDSARYARELGAQRIWMLPQVFGQSSWRAPAAAEFLIQIFSSLAEGATGFAPYAYADRPQWHDPVNEYGHLVDPYGNPSPVWDQMQRLGPYLRSAGALLAGAHRLPDEAAVAQISARVVSPVGRQRPGAVARAFRDDRRQARYLVVYNNTPAYRWTFPVALAEMAEGERVLDLFARRDVPRAGNTFTAYLEPGDGRLYAVGLPAALAAIKQEVLATHVAIERDLLELELRVAQRLGTDTAVVAPILATAATLEDLAAARLALQGQQRANALGWAIQEDIEGSRRSLGRSNTLLCRRVGDPACPRDAPDVRALTDRMVSLSERFYALQAHWLRGEAPALAPTARALRDDVERQEAAVRGLLGG